MDQRFLNQLIQQTTNGQLIWEETGAFTDCATYSCQYPFRVAIDPSHPRKLFSIDLVLGPDNLEVWDITNKVLNSLPKFNFISSDYLQSLQRLRELAATQVELSGNEDYAAVVGGLLKGN